MRRWTQAEAIRENERARAHISQSQIDHGYGQFRLDLVHRIVRDKLKRNAVIAILEGAAEVFQGKGIEEEIEAMRAEEDWPGREPERPGFLKAGLPEGAGVGSG